MNPFRARYIRLCNLLETLLEFCIPVIKIMGSLLRVMTEFCSLGVLCRSFYFLFVVTVGALLITNDHCTALRLCYAIGPFINYQLSNYFKPTTPCSLRNLVRLLSVFSQLHSRLTTARKSSKLGKLGSSFGHDIICITQSMVCFQ